jgi:hypothetical protein
MNEPINQKLADAKERKYQLQKAERKREELKKRLHTLERQVIKLELLLESEQADVDKLTKMTLTNLFHTILRSKDEQLKMERQQALSAALKLQEAQQELADTKDLLHSVGNDLANFQNAEQEYKELMLEKLAALRSRATFSNVLVEMEEQLEEQTYLVKELQEAWTAGRRVLTSLENASASLEKAENWGKWDMWANGGLISTHIKHNHIDDARSCIHNANHQMLNFRDELKDLNRSIAIEIDISSMLKMADYWFDGLITDWIVQGRIKSSQDQTLKAIHAIRGVVNQLQAEHAAAESALNIMNNKRRTWIEEQGLEE